MSGVLPKGENSRRAVKWISTNLTDVPQQELWKLIEQAITKFNLNPMESEMLMQFYRQKSNDE